MTIEQYEKAGEILELHYFALKRKSVHLEAVNGFWAGESPEYKARHLHSADISQMAADRIYKKYKQHILKHL